jgi:hypothetical protein
MLLICALQVTSAERPLAAPNGGSVRVLPGRACHSALRCRASISRGRGYRPGTPTSLGEPIGGWPRVSMSGTAGGGPIMRRNPCGSHGRPPRGPPGTEGTVLICPCAAGRRGLPDGGSTRWQGHRGGSCRSSGRLSPRCPEVGAGSPRRVWRLSCLRTASDLTRKLIQNSV